MWICGERSAVANCRPGAISYQVSKIVHNEFLGSWLLFWALSISILGIPLALLYLLVGTVRIEVDMEDPEAFVAAFKSGKLRNKK